METSFFEQYPYFLPYALAGGAVGIVLVAWLVLENYLQKRHGFESLPFWVMVATMLPAGFVNALIRDAWPLEPLLSWPRTFVVYGLFFFAVSTWRWARKRRSTPRSA